MQKSVTFSFDDFDTNNCVNGVMKYPMNHAEVRRDFVNFEAWNTLIATNRAKALNPASINPAQKQRQLSNKNVFFAMSVFEKFSNINSHQQWHIF